MIELGGREVGGRAARAAVEYALQQESLDLRRHAEELEEELAAAREANRQLMNQVNRPGVS